MFAKIRHVALYTDDYNKMAAFYQTIFAMKKITRSIADPERGHLSDGIIGLAINPARPGIRPGLDHFGFEVADLQAAVDTINTRYPNILVAQALENAPFAVVRSHDPAGSQFDISQRDIAKVREGYKEDGWEQARHLNHVAIRASQPESVAEFYQRVFQLKPVEGLCGDGCYCLTDGKVRLFIHPTNNTSYTSMREGLDHIGFKVESLDKAKQDLESISLSAPLSAPRRIDAGRFGYITRREMEACKIGSYALADPDGTPLHLSED